MASVGSPPVLDPSTGLTCIACRVMFSNGQIQRDHYKSDWHRYNLKRQVAELPAVTAEQFQLKVLSFRDKAAEDALSASKPSFCDVCNKQFQSVNAYENHLNSKKHKENSLKPVLRKERQNTETEATPKDEKKETESAAGSAVPVADVDMESEGDDDDSSGGWVTDHGTDDEDEDEFFDETKGIPVSSCLFCSSPSGSMEQNVTHMSIAHGFFLPDANYCVDVEGMLRYLGLKVGSGNMCLLCNERGKRFRSVDACQKHMRDKGHCRVSHEGTEMIEFEEFYDYSSMYPEGDDDTDVTDVVVDDGYTLTLPSGARIGHRSLMRYYRQHLKPIGDESRNERRGREAINKMIGQYKALGWTGTTGPLAVQRAKDIRFMKRLDAKHWMKLGMKANKLFKSQGRVDQ